MLVEIIKELIDLYNYLRAGVSQSVQWLDHRLNDWRIGILFQEEVDFFSSCPDRFLLTGGASNRSVRRAVSVGVSGRSMKLITHLHLVPKLRIRGTIFLLLHYRLWVQLYTGITEPLAFTILGVHFKTILQLQMLYKPADALKDNLWMINEK